MDLIKKYTLNDFFSNTFKLFIPVLKKTYIPLIVLLLPFSILYGLIMLDVFSTFAEVIPNMMNNMAYDPMSAISPLIPFYGKIILVSILQGLAASLAVLIVMNHTASMIFPDRPVVGWKELLSHYFVRVLLTGLLQIALLIGLIIAAAIVIVLLTLIFSLINEGLGIVIGILLYIGLYAGMIWLGVSILLSTWFILIEDCTPWESLKRSFFLVRHNWWRFLGISLLFYLCVSFAASLITTPISSFSMLNTLSEYLSSIDLYGTMSDDYLLDMMVEMYSSFASPGYLIGLAASSAIGSFLFALVITISRSLFYVDLKVRKGELALGDQTEVTQ